MRKNRRALPGLEAAPEGIQDCQGNMGPSSAMSTSETLGFTGTSDQIQTTEQSEESHDTELIVLDEESSAEKWLLNKKLRSKVWKEYTLELVDGSVKAICKHCKNELVAGRKMGTSHLQYHLKACTVLCSSKRRRSGSTPKADIPKFEQEQSREDFSRMIVCHSYSFNMCEHYYTRVFISRLQPFFRLGHRTSVTGDCLKLYESEKSKLYEMFKENASRISITSDLWTATEMSCYMSMTAHYIDADWKLHKKIIGFVHIEGPHNGENVGQELIKRLYDWNLDRKLFFFVLDNSSVNDVVIRDLLDALLPKKVLHLNGDLFHVRCAAHILNLIVQDGLK